LGSDFHKYIEPVIQQIIKFKKEKKYGLIIEVNLFAEYWLVSGMDASMIS